MSTPDNSNAPALEVYPGAPLRAVAVELHFPALLDTYARLGEFQRRHSEFDRLVFGDSSAHIDDDSAAILFGKEKERALAVSLDRVAAVTYTYSEGFTGFKSWALPLLLEALSDIRPAHVVRVRYRYENVIPVPSEGEVLLEPKFTIVLPRGQGAEKSVRNLHLYWKQQWPEGGAVDIALDGCADMVEPGTIQLNITAQCAGGPIADVEERVAEAHRMARSTFEELITPEYRDFLRRKAKE